AAAAAGASPPLAPPGGGGRPAARRVAPGRGNPAITPLVPHRRRPRLHMHPGGQGDVFRDRQLAEDLALLRREADAKPRDPVRPQPDEVDAVEGDRAGCRLAKTHDGAERRGLAGTVATTEVHPL